MPNTIAFLYFIWLGRVVFEVKLKSNKSIGTNDKLQLSTKPESNFKQCALASSIPNLQLDSILLIHLCGKVN